MQHGRVWFSYSLKLILAQSEGKGALPAHACRLACLRDRVSAYPACKYSRACADHPWVVGYGKNIVYIWYHLNFCPHRDPVPKQGEKINGQHHMLSNTVMWLIEHVNKNSVCYNKATTYFIKHNRAVFEATIWLGYSINKHVRYVLSVLWVFLIECVSKINTFVWITWWV